MWNHFYTPLTIVPHLYYQFQGNRRDEIFRPKTRIIRLKYPQHHLRTSPRVSSIDLASIRQHSFFHTKCRIIREKSSPMFPYTSHELPPYAYGSDRAKFIFPYKKSNYSSKFTLRLPIYLPWVASIDMKNIGQSHFFHIKSRIIRL